MKRFFISLVQMEINKVLIFSMSILLCTSCAQREETKKTIESFSPKQSDSVDWKNEKGYISSRNSINISC